MNGEGSDSEKRFGEQLAAHRSRVFAYVSRHIGTGSGLAEDVTQDCLVRVWTAREHNPPPVAALYTYLRTTAQNLLRDRFRKNELETSAESLERIADVAVPEAHVLLRETTERLAAEVALMPPVLRETLRLRAMEGYDYPAIAVRMDCPVGTVKSRLHAARARLQTALVASETLPDIGATVRSAERHAESPRSGTITTTRKEQNSMTTNEIAGLRAHVQAIEARLARIENGAATATTDLWDTTVQTFGENVKRERTEKGSVYGLGIGHLVTQDANNGGTSTRYSITTLGSASDLPDDQTLLARWERMRLLTADPAVPRVFRHFYALRFAGKAMRATAGDLAEATGESAERIAALLQPLVADRTLLLLSDGAGGETYTWKGSDIAITALLFAVFSEHDRARG